MGYFQYMNTDYKKVAGVLIFNDKNELALQLRAEHDSSFPGHWDISAGGGIDEGETELESANREMKEELGIESELEFIAHKHYTYDAWKPGVTREVDIWLYRTTYNGEFHLNLDEVTDIVFKSIDEIKEMVNSGEKFHPELLLVFKDGLIDEIKN